MFIVRMTGGTESPSKQEEAIAKTVHWMKEVF